MPYVFANAVTESLVLMTKWENVPMPLTFEDNAAYDIPAGTQNSIYTTSVALVATDGTAPYTFSIDPAVSGLSINGENKPVYTRPDVQGATTATIKVTDSAGASKTITINIGAVTPTGDGC